MIITLSGFVFPVFSIFSQGPPPENWYHLSPEKSGFNGIGLEEVYREFPIDQKSQPVIVAVLDTGVDIDHEDLKDVIWVNADEIPDNGQDDDENGYVDDVHGWNFIGSADGSNVIKETLEVTRLYGRLRERFEGADVSSLSRKERKQYDQYLEYKQVVEKKRKSARKQIEEYKRREEWINSLLVAALEAAGDTIVDQTLVETLQAADDEVLSSAAGLLESILEQKIDELYLSELIGLIGLDFQAARAHFEEELEYTYNPEFDSRAIIGDDYDDPEDRYYGNSAVGGDFSFHGTHVAGIIGAVRDNETGVDGIAGNVRIMPVRMVPDGDEHDKDVANAIRYAVDNGAQVINMSFGKGQSWDKRIVDKAVRYALKNDVLLIHSAGNSGRENFADNNFPNPFFDRRFIFGRKRAPNWIEVGAVSYTPGKKAVAGFSNYSQDRVDLFAPGVAIYSTAPDDSYAYAQGTSMSAPVVTGTAALLRAYFPELKAVQVKEILMHSVRPISGKVIQPGTSELVDGSELSVSGGMLDAYAAFKLAAHTKGKKKRKKVKDLRS